MSIRIIKFGGSNFKFPSDYCRASTIINNYSKPLLVVISAHFGVTNTLIEFTTSILDAGVNFLNKINSLKSLHEGIANKCINDNALKSQCNRSITEELESLEKVLIGIRYIGEIPESTCENIITYGERLNAILLKHVLLDIKIDSEIIHPEDLKLITDGTYEDASINITESSKSIANKTFEDKVYIIPGFYGVSPEGRINTFGRGGSDYSAASIAKCLKADSLDIWKDVNGFMSADPKIISGAKRIDKLSYDEAAELAYFGAKILHPRTIEPLKADHIPIRIFNIETQKDNCNPLTVINSETSQRKGIVKSVTYSDDFAVLKLKGPAVGIRPGIMAKVASLFEDNGINIKSIITSHISINFLLSEKYIDQAHKCVKEANINVVNEISVTKDLSTIAVVGDGMLDQFGLAGQIFSVVAQNKINVLMIASGASYVSTYFIINRNNRDLAIQSINNEFF